MRTTARLSRCNHFANCRENIPIYIQQDVALHSSFISVNCSTCFGWYLHPSSGAHTTVSTASGTGQTLTAICRCRGGVETIAAGSSNGLTSTRCCRYSCVAPDDGWRYRPNHVEQFTEINKLCNIISCWKYIRIYLWRKGPWKLNVEKMYVLKCLVPENSGFKSRVDIHNM